MSIDSIGELIDRLVIENVKIFDLRDKMESSETDKDRVDFYRKMMLCNENRALIADELDKKVSRVVEGKEKNIFIRRIRTYEE